MMVVIASNAPIYIGFGIAFAVIAVVVALVAVLLALASRIAEQARAAAAALEQVRENTALLPAVGAVNEKGLAILAAAQAARKVLGG
jgi:Sec-independent protein translocase protein TatA